MRTARSSPTPRNEDSRGRRRDSPPRTQLRTLVPGTAAAWKPTRGGELTPRVDGEKDLTVGELTPQVHGEEDLAADGGS